MPKSLYNLNFANASDSPIPGEGDQPCDPGDMACLAAVAATGTAPATVSSTLTSLASSSIGVGSLQIPVWLIGAGLVALVLFGGKK